MKYELVTAGERLAYLISTKLLAHVPWGKLSPALLATGRSEQLIEFFEELTVINLTCRIVATGTSLLKAREGRKARLPSDPGFVADYRGYLRENLHISREHIELIYRQADRALAAVSNDLTASEGSRLRRHAQVHHRHCYMCGVDLNFGEHERAPIDEDPIHRVDRERRNAHRYTCEHIWPQSYGGDSVEGNFLPSCDSCNTSKKMGFATWAMAGVQALIFGLAPSANELARVEGPYRFAMHYYAARRLAQKKNTTLKNAFLGLKPWADVRVGDPGDSGDFFNLETHHLADT